MGNTGRGRGEDLERTVKEVLRQASTQGYVDYSVFDDDGDGIIQSDELAVGLIVHGYETSTIGFSHDDYPSIWGHANWGFELAIDDVTLTGYFAQGAYHFQNSLGGPSNLLTMGIIAHELGHASFGFIDLYDVFSYALELEESHGIGM